VVRSGKSIVCTLHYNSINFTIVVHVLHLLNNYFASYFENSYMYNVTVVLTADMGGGGARGARSSPPLAKFNQQKYSHSRYY
jgi:hypothetical protein